MKLLIICKEKSMKDDNKDYSFQTVFFILVLSSLDNSIRKNESLKIQNSDA